MDCYLSSEFNIIENLSPLDSSVLANYTISNKMEQVSPIPYSDKRLKELEEVKMMLSNRYKVKFLDSRPPGLREEEEIIKKTGSTEMMMTLKLGNYTESECVSVFVRRIDGAHKDIFYLASNELKCLDNLDGLQVAVETLFYFIELSAENPEQLSYVVAFQRFGNNLNNIPRNRETIKVISINLFKSYQILQKNLVYHGNLCLDYIFVDDSLSVRFYNFMLGGLTNEFPNIKPKILLHFADSLCCSPEVKLVIICYENSLTRVKFDPLKSDLFSLGLVALRLYANFNSLNDLQLESKIAWLINLKSESKLEQAFLKNEIDSDIAIEAIGKLKSCITRTVAPVPSRTIRHILKRLLIVYYSKRNLKLSQTEIKPVIAQDDKKNIQWFNRKPEDTSDDTKIKNILFNVCAFFSKTSKDYYKISDSVKSLHEELLVLKHRFQDELRTLISIYEDQPCRSDISMTYGIAEAVSYVFAIFQNEFQFRLFLEQSQGYQPDYEKQFGYFMTQTDEIVKDFIITSLLHSRFQLCSELQFMFDKSAYLDLSYANLSQFPGICGHFESLLNCSFISQMITECSGTTCDLIAAFHDILPFCYLFIMKPRLCGVLSMNLRIFIRDYFRIQSYNKKISRKKACRDDQAQAAVLIVMLHEFTHYLRRRQIQLRKDLRKVKTPKSREFPIANLENKGEGGNLLENRLFGKKLEYVTIEAAKVLLNHKEKSLEQFQLNFSLNNIFNPAALPMREEMEGLEIGYCGPPFTGFDDLEYLVSE